MSFLNKVDLMGKIDNSPINAAFGSMTNGIGALDETQTGSFKDVMTGVAHGLNNDLAAPNELLKSAMSGESDVDIHDVMTAMAKAEISINVATQVTSKVIQAYDKIMQISV